MSTKTLKQIPTSNIKPNEHNPRMFFDESDLAPLRNSMSNVGILVPLTVYKESGSNDKYVLLDGERRWRCAKDLNLKVVPANIIDKPKDITQNILFMFNIHYYRKEWDLVPTALKLEELMTKLKTNSDTELVKFTGLKHTVVRRCKQLLWYPSKYRNLLLAKDPRVSTDFLIELFPIIHKLSQEEEFSSVEKRSGVIDVFIEKFQKKLITDVKEFREIRRCFAYYEGTNMFGEAVKRMKDFLTKEKVGLEIFATADIKDDTNRRNVIKYVAYLNESLAEINPENFSDMEFLIQLKSLNRQIVKILDIIE